MPNKMYDQKTSSVPVLGGLQPPKPPCKPGGCAPRTPCNTGGLRPPDPLPTGGLCASDPLRNRGAPPHGPPGDFFYQ